jgi:hypothetical protein
MLQRLRVTTPSLPRVAGRRASTLGAKNPFAAINPQDKSMQEAFLGTAPTTGGVCYGCGPANDCGLQLRSYVSVDDVESDGGKYVVRRIESVARFTPKKHHNAFPNVLNGGIIATLLDCHCNNLAYYYVMRARLGPSADAIPVMTVTARFEMDLKRATPMDTDVFLWAAIDIGASDGTKGNVWIDGKMFAGTPELLACNDIGSVPKPTVLCRGRFVAPAPKAKL